MARDLSLRELVRAKKFPSRLLPATPSEHSQQIIKCDFGLILYQRMSIAR